MTRHIISLILFVGLFTCFVQAQVAIAPTNLFLDNQSRFGTYMIINGSDTPQEISVDFFFGYAITDENGDRKNITGDEELDDLYSVADQIRAFPRSFVLQPNQRQIVRIRLSPPNNLEDGTYWARVKTTSSAESTPVELDSDDNVVARVGINIEQVTGLFYKNGDVTTGIEVQGIRTSFTGENNNRLNILTDYKRTGNSPFLGSITTQLLNENNKTIAQEFISTSLYFDGTQKEVIDISNLPSGKYTIQVRFETSRSDISGKDLVQMQPLTETTTVNIP